MSQKNFNLPNILTFLRLAMVPVTVCLILSDQTIAAFAVFLAACLTDLLDGYIARKYNLTTKLGIWLDPLADKMMAVAVIVCFTIEGILPLAILIIVFAKEFLMLLGGFIILRKGHVTPSNKFGKIAALLLNISIASGFLHEYWYPYYLYATYVAVAAVLVAFVQYAIVNGHLLFEKGPKEKKAGEEKSADEQK